MAFPSGGGSVRGLLSVDLRRPDPDILDEMDRDFRQVVTRECEGAQLKGCLDEVWHMPATAFDPGCVDAVRSATEKLGYSHMEMVSGAGHDLLYVAKVAPTGMIFVPCEKAAGFQIVSRSKRR